MVDLTSMGYVPETTEANTGFKALPAGNYAAVATDVDFKKEGPDNAPTKAVLKVTFEVIEGDFKGRKVFDNFNIINASKQAQDIGHAQFKEWNIALGTPNNGNPELNKNKPVVLKVSNKKDANYGDDDGNRNDVKGYLSYGVQSQASAVTPQPVAQQAAAPAGNAPSWANSQGQ